MCIIPDTKDTKHRTKETKCAMQTNQQVQGCQSLSSHTILEMLNQLPLHGLVIKYDFNPFLAHSISQLTAAGYCHFGRCPVGKSCLSRVCLSAQCARGASRSINRSAQRMRGAPRYQGLAVSWAPRIGAHEWNELMQSRGVRRPSVCLSVCLSVRL